MPNAMPPIARPLHERLPEEARSAPQPQRRRRVAHGWGPEVATLARWDHPMPAAMPMSSLAGLPPPLRRQLRGPSRAALVAKATVETLAVYRAGQIELWGLNEAGRIERIIVAALLCRPRWLKLELAADTVTYTRPGRTRAWVAVHWCPVDAAKVVPPKAILPEPQPVPEPETVAESETAPEVAFTELSPDQQAAQIRRELAALKRVGWKPGKPLEAELRKRLKVSPRARIDGLSRWTVRRRFDELD